MHVAMDEIAKQTKKNPPLIVFNELVLPPLNSSRKWIEEDMKDIPLRPDDIWIVSYPKAGTTWTQQIVKLINNNGEDDDVKIDESIPWVEMFNDKYRFDLDSYSSPRAFKSHFPYHLMPCGLPSNTPGRYIYVARNPKDVAVSMYHHAQALVGFPKMEWDVFFELFIAGKFPFGDYFEHVLGWWKHRDDPNVLFIKYEDMKKDLHSSIEKIVSFLGSDIGKSTIISIAENSSFSSMRKNPTTNATGEVMNGIVSFDPNKPFIRKGIVGDWKNYFTPEQSARIDALYKEKLLSAGLEFDFTV